MTSFESVTVEMKERGLNLEKVKNTWAEPGSPTAGPYRGINTQWRTAEGQAFELQFHTPESFAVKQNTHLMYEEARALETSPERAEELARMMTRMSDEIPVPDGAIP